MSTGGVHRRRRRAAIRPGSVVPSLADEVESGGRWLEPARRSPQPKVALTQEQLREQLRSKLRQLRPAARRGSDATADRPSPSPGCACPSVPVRAVITTDEAEELHHRQAPPRPEDLDRVIVETLRGALGPQPGFVAYRLPSRQWKLLLTPKTQRWPKSLVRRALGLAHRAGSPQIVSSAELPESAGITVSGPYLLLPLQHTDDLLGVAFFALAAQQATPSAERVTLAQLADFVAMTIVDCLRPARLTAGERLGRNPMTQPPATEAA